MLSSSTSCILKRAMTVVPWPRVDVDEIKKLAVPEEDAALEEGLRGALQPPLLHLEEGNVRRAMWPCAILHLEEGNVRQYRMRMLLWRRAYEVFSSSPAAPPAS